MLSLKLTSTDDLRNAQQKDPGVGEVWLALSQEDKFQGDDTKHQPCLLLMTEWDRLKMNQGVMYRITNPPGRSHRSQLVLPDKYGRMILTSLHDDPGHFGFDKTYGLFKDRFYLARIKSDVEEYCKSFVRCIRSMSWRIAGFQTPRLWRIKCPTYQCFGWNQKIEMDPSRFYIEKTICCP